ncbi:MAG: DUF5681 domain-containing protein [Pseudomonadota bacterium]|nr:DUF5681 domain-containing protein [Pseudomonadota bacterium]
MSDDPGDIGKGRPPVGSQFKPGQSGNPKGRPRGRRSKTPYDVVLGRTVTIRENGVERQLRADAAFLLHIVTKGLARHGVEARASLRALASRPPSVKNSRIRTQIIFRIYAEPGDLKHAVRTLQIAKLLDGFRPTARLALETWAVEEALARRGDRQLPVEEQRKVVEATRMPHKVRWPAWWAPF